MFFGINREGDAKDFEEMDDPAALTGGGTVRNTELNRQCAPPDTG